MRRYHETHTRSEVHEAWTATGSIASQKARASIRGIDWPVQAVFRRVRASEMTLGFGKVLDHLEGTPKSGAEKSELTCSAYT